jgi:hypothetical protein
MQRLSSGNTGKYKRATVDITSSISTGNTKSIIKDQQEEKL